MKLSHLFEAGQPEPLAKYVDRLTGGGIKQLGNGINSFVFQHPTLSNVAVKVFMDDDVGAQEYIEFCIAHPKNKYSTTVLEEADFSAERRSKYVKPLELHANWNVERGDNPPYSIVFLEKLNPLDNNAFADIVKRLTELSGVEGANSLPKIGKAGWEVIAKDNSDADLKQLAEFLLKMLAQGHKLDLGNRKNFMMRGSEVVFVDPLF